MKPLKNQRLAVETAHVRISANFEASHFDQRGQSGGLLQFHLIGPANFQAELSLVKRLSGHIRYCAEHVPLQGIAEI